MFRDYLFSGGETVLGGRSDVGQEGSCFILLSGYVSSSGTSLRLCNVYNFKMITMMLDDDGTN